MNRLVPVSALVVASLAMGGDAFAHARGVGLGVAAGVNVADAEADQVDSNTSFAWGFFVDIPLLETFYITPAATLYQLQQGDRRVSITDIDLNFKFLVPVGAMSLGIGVTGGLTTGLGDYQPHYGLLAYFGYNVVGNLELFVTGQYKRLTTNSDVPTDYNNIHVFGGTMFRF